MEDAMTDITDRPWILLRHDHDLVRHGLARRNLSFTTKWFAIAAGVDQSTISRWERRTDWHHTTMPSNYRKALESAARCRVEMLTSFLRDDAPGRDDGAARVALVLTVALVARKIKSSPSTVHRIESTTGPHRRLVRYANFLTEEAVRWANMCNRILGTSEYISAITIWNRVRKLLLREGKP